VGGVGELRPGAAVGELRPGAARASSGKGQREQAPAKDAAIDSLDSDLTDPSILFLVTVRSASGACSHRGPLSTAPRHHRRRRPCDQ
jgi:hypothetical protein